MVITLILPYRKNIKPTTCKAEKQGGKKAESKREREREREREDRTGKERRVRREAKKEGKNYSSCTQQQHAYATLCATA